MAITWDKQPASRMGATQNVAFNAAGGASTQSTTFGSQTYQIRVAVSGTGSVAGTGGVRIAIGDNPTATATSMFVPNVVAEYFTVTPGQKVAVLGNDAGTGNLSVVEFS
jgi:outer membrane protein W